MDAEGAIAALGEITGETVTESVVTRIFSDFCVGKVTRRPNVETMWIGAACRAVAPFSGNNTTKRNRNIKYYV